MFRKKLSANICELNVNTCNICTFVKCSIRIHQEQETTGIGNTNLELFTYGELLRKLWILHLYNTVCAGLSVNPM